MRFGEFVKEWGVTMEVVQWGERNASLCVGLIYGAWFIRLPFFIAKEWDRSHCLAPSYGFSWKWSGYRGDLFLHWFDKCKILHMPWSWEHVRYSALMADGTWRTQKKFKKGDEPFSEEQCSWDWKGRFRESYAYQYTLKNGTKQERTATVQVEEREWRWRWFSWLPFPRKIHRSIDVKFSDEVGEKTGSWKGGCVGCCYNMRAGESPLDTLRRMEQERSFT